MRLLFSPFIKSNQPRYTKALVVASTSADDTSWLSFVPHDWALHKYVVDAPPASPALSVPANKGNEAMVYLSYIITHYDALPDVVFFHHAHHRAWHQELDSAAEVASLRASYVVQQGYASARCLPGCENVVPLADHRVELREFRAAGRSVHLTTLLDEFLSAEEKSQAVPEKLAAPCCAQFAVSREAIRRRSREWWLRLRDWLLETPLDSRTSGRLLEHLWHVWFGQPFHQYVYFPRW